MRAFIVRTLDDRDREFVETLHKLGIHQNVAAIITYLMNVNEATSKQIEMGTNLRQPEVSIGAKMMRHNGWIDESQLKRDGKGRPTKVYKLRTPIDEIIKHLEEKRIRESDNIMQSIQKLKQMAAS
jgi:predicted transcriptional regulator